MKERHQEHHSTLPGTTMWSTTMIPAHQPSAPFSSYDAAGAFEKFLFNLKHELNGRTEVGCFVFVDVKALHSGGRKIVDTRRMGSQ